MLRTPPASPKLNTAHSSEALLAQSRGMQACNPVMTSFVAPIQNRYVSESGQPAEVHLTTTEYRDDLLDPGTEAHRRFQSLGSGSSAVHSFGLNVLRMGRPLVIVAHGLTDEQNPIRLSDYTFATSEYVQSSEKEAVGSEDFTLIDNDPLKYLFPNISFEGPEGYVLWSSGPVGVAAETPAGLYAYKPEEVGNTSQDLSQGIYHPSVKKMGIVPNYFLSEDYVPEPKTVYHYPDTAKGKVGRIFNMTRLAEDKEVIAFEEGATTSAKKQLMRKKAEANRSLGNDFDILHVKSGTTSLKDIVETLYSLKIHYQSIRVYCCRGGSRRRELVDFARERLGKSPKGLVNKDVMLERINKDPGAYAEKLNQLNSLHSLLLGIKGHAEKFRAAELIVATRGILLSDAKIIVGLEADEDDINEFMFEQKILEYIELSSTFSKTGKKPHHPGSSQYLEVVHMGIEDLRVKEKSLLEKQEIQRAEMSSLVLILNSEGIEKAEQERSDLIQKHIQVSLEYANMQMEVLQISNRIRNLSRLLEA